VSARVSPSPQGVPGRGAHPKHAARRFSVSNLLGVLATMMVSGVPFAQATAALELLDPVSGRMERIAAARSPWWWSITRIPRCAGQGRAGPEGRGHHGGRAPVRGLRLRRRRDRGKRPLMGAVASRHADRIIVTSDNPRGEDPNAIIAEVAAASPLPTRRSRTGARRLPPQSPRHARATWCCSRAKATRLIRKSQAKSCRFPMCARRKRHWGAGSHDEHRGRAQAVGGQVHGGRRASPRCPPTAARRKRAPCSSRCAASASTGHGFIEAARARGAAAAMVDRASGSRRGRRDCLHRRRRHAPGAGRLAGHWRARCHPPGRCGRSNGKTTVKEMIAAILRAHYGEQPRWPRRAI